MRRGCFTGRGDRLEAELPPTKEKQEKALTLFRVRAGHNIPQCGLFSGISSDAFSHGHELE